MQDAYGGRISFKQAASSSDSADGGQSAAPASAGGTKRSADGSAAQPDQAGSVPPASGAADGPSANGAAAEPHGTQHEAVSNGVHSPDENAAQPAAASPGTDSAEHPVRGEQPPGAAEEPSSGVKPPGLQSMGQEPASQQQQRQEQGSKQQSAVFDGHDLSPGIQMLHVGDEVEFTLVFDRMGADPRATRVRQDQGQGQGRGLGKGEPLAVTGVEVVACQSAAVIVPLPAGTPSCLRNALNFYCVLLLRKAGCRLNATRRRKDICMADV